MKILIYSVFIPLWLTACHNSTVYDLHPSRELIEEHIAQEVTVYGSWAAVKLPIETGVTIWNPIQVVRGPEGLIYAANITGEIYSLLDRNGDGLEDHAKLFCDVTEDGLRTPAGMAFKDNDLYVGTAQEIRVYSDRDGDLKADTSYTFFDEIPHSEHPYEYTSGLTFGPDDHLYFALATDSWNAGASSDPEGWRGSILRISPGGKPESFCTGIRSVPAMVFDNQDNLLFVDNEGGGNPTEELNLAVKNAFYGHNPYKYNNPSVTHPLFDLQMELAPSGMVFNSESNDFDNTAGDLFVSYYGPGNRWKRGAVSRLKMHLNNNNSFQIEEIPVAKGLAKLSDLAFGDNGDLYVSQTGKTDYWYQPLEEVDGAFYRLIHVPWVTPSPFDSTNSGAIADSGNDQELGQHIFVERICDACHAIDGSKEMLGPNLKGIGKIYTREELLEEINEPSKRIKPSMNATCIVIKDGEKLLGRVVSTDTEKVQLMITGNRVIGIPRNDILFEEPVTESLMYEGLLNGLTDKEINALLDYILTL